jgi:hypothetical protein
LKMLDTHATFADGSNSTEAGIMEMQDRMTSGRFKVAAHLTQWFDEFRSYHRKDGQLVKIKDDLLSATRIAVMAKRFAKQLEMLRGDRAKPRRPQPKEGEDGMFDWTW